MRFGPPGARGLRPGRLRCRPARMHSPAPGTRAGTTAPCISRVHYRAAHHLPHGSQKLVCRGRRLTTGTWPSFGEIVCFPSEPFQTTAFRAPERGLVSPGMITEVSLHELVKPWPARSCVLEWGARKTEQVPGQPRNCAVHEGSIETSGRDTNVYAKKGVFHRSIIYKEKCANLNQTAWIGTPGWLSSCASALGSRCDPGVRLPARSLLLLPLPVSLPLSLCISHG
ncbi:uncharacterized protein LOC112667747 isoform X2 [Canis lupus dingo]|uniref:uncharacterized protein LOC112667747 isoform X2 n=1 Tax=Canis lupus dingo TaxID=286419 RepID=UPI0020C4DDE2|nr:uncharacterized protein LOC112667747 isoform X2 [Canis lupus dingo]